MRMTFHPDGLQPFYSQLVTGISPVDREAVPGSGCRPNNDAARLV